MMMCIEHLAFFLNNDYRPLVAPSLLLPYYVRTALSLLPPVSLTRPRFPHRELKVPCP